MKTAKLLLALVLVFSLVLSLTFVPCAAVDFGDFSGDNDFDFGGSDYGGSDYGGSDYGGGDDDDGGSLFSIFFMLFSILPWPIQVIVILAAIAFFVFRFVIKGKGSSSAQKNTPVRMQREAQPALRPMNEYYPIDPDFNEEAFREKLSNLYVQMQNGWTAKDIEPLRPYFSDALYTQMERQLQAYKNNHRTNYVERIAVLSVSLKGFRQTPENDLITAVLQTRIVDYTLDDNTGAVLSGNRTREKFMTYEWDLVRSKGRTTSATAGVKKIFCPNCGAPLDVNSSARCEYCGSVIHADNYDWQLAAIRAISQRTM